MDPVVLIGFWAALFLATHIAISSSLIRPRLIETVGEQPYRGIYSLMAFGTLIPLVVMFSRNKHSGPMLWNLRDVPAVRWLVWLMMAAALILTVAGFINPNPAMVGAPATSGNARGVLKITRHPTFVALAMFGLAHMLMNGFAGDLLFFGTFPALAIVGGMHQDRRKLLEMGDKYARLMAETSFFPGAALWQGRQRWSAADFPWLPIGIGVALTAAIVFFHPMLFGGNPLAAG
jgi:uncharacterized membrane protein